jgi:hypothetical protein
MSGHGDPHDEAHGDGHDEHDDDHHAPAPLPEPATPLWLTLLGIGLFLAAGILFVATRADGKTTAELTAVPAADAPAPTPAAPTPAAPGTAPTPGQPMARPPGGAPINPPTTPPGAARPAGGSKKPGHEGHDHD